MEQKINQNYFLKAGVCWTVMFGFLLLINFIMGTSLAGLIITVIVALWIITIACHVGLKVYG
jgi:hypothetical protein